MGGRVGIYQTRARAPVAHNSTMEDDMLPPARLRVDSFPPGYALVGNDGKNQYRVRLPSGRPSQWLTIGADTFAIDEAGGGGAYAVQRGVEAVMEWRRREEFLRSSMWKGELAQRWGKRSWRQCEAAEDLLAEIDSFVPISKPAPQQAKLERQEVHIVWGGLPCGTKPPAPGLRSAIALELVNFNCPFAQVVCGEASESLTSMQLVLDVAGRWSEGRMQGVAMRWAGVATMFLYLADEHFMGCSGALDWEGLGKRDSAEFVRLYRGKDSPYSDAFLAWAQTVFKGIVPMHPADRERLSAQPPPSPSRFSPPPSLMVPHLPAYSPMDVAISPQALV